MYDGLIELKIFGILMILCLYIYCISKGGESLFLEKVNYIVVLFLEGKIIKYVVFY